MPNTKVARYQVSFDYVPMRSWPLFRARALLQAVIALIIRNFEDNPEQAMLTDAGTYVGEAVNDEFFRSVA